MSRFVLTAQLQLQAPNNVAQIARQIQSQLNNVNVNVQVQNVGQAQRQLNSVTTACNTAATAADRVGRAFGTSIRRFAALGIATRAVSLFTNTISSAIKEAIAFDQELVKIIQVSGATRQELNSLVSTVTRLSTSLGVSSRDVLEAGKVLVQAGVSFDDARIALDALAKSALAPNFDSLAETTEGAVAILAQFKQGVGALEGQLSSVNAVAGAFAVEAADLIDVVRRAGGVFKSSGGSLNELLALFTSVRATTRESAESIGTGLRTIFTRIQRPKTIEFLKQFGIQLTDLNGRFVGPFEAVKRLSDALAGLGEGDITFIRIAEELGGFRQIGKVLPLLQQFQTAQEALNVAQNAGTGLTKDALTAQQALAVRITKVKEEFLALARSITETTSFQVFANTALNLASALIKLADSLQPIIPLLTAVAGIRLARGFGNFAGGILGGLGSPRGFNKGGKVHHFASGGIVPGSGNRDTVPAMLTPGEFVIRKSSVNKLGANNLAAMNENRYAIGGVVGGVALTPSDQTSTGRGKVTITDIIKALTTNSNIPGGISGNKAIFEGVTSRKQANEIIASVGGFNNTTPSSSRSFTAKGQSFKDADLDRQIGDDVDVGMKNLISNAAAILGNSIGVSISGSPDARLIQSIGSADVIGKIFEGALNLLGAPFDPLAAKQDRDAFDFPLGLGGALGSYFKGFENIPVDAKKNLNPSILDDIATRKTKNLIAGQINTSPQFQALKQSTINQRTLKKHFGGIIQKFAVGGKAIDTLEKYYTDSASINLGLANSRSLNKDQRSQLATDVKNLRQLRTQAPSKLYSSISRVAFDRMAEQTGLNKTPDIPQGAKLNDITNYYNQEAKKIVGRSFSLPGFVSTSKDIRKAKTFLDNAPRSEDRWAAMMSIQTKQNAKGIDVVNQLQGRKINNTKQEINPRTGKMETFYMQQPEAEQEVLLSPRSRFKVQKSDYVNLFGKNNLWMDVQQFKNGGISEALVKNKKKKRGFFFDFDDTLATTGAIERPGTDDPYSDFRGKRGKQLLESASATRYVAMAKKRAEEGHDIWVLTARPGDKDTTSGIRTFGAKNGLMFKGIIGVAGMASKTGVDTATAKSTIISRYAKNYPDGIIFADDLKENIISAQQTMQKSGTPFKSVIAKKYFGGLIQKFATGGSVGTDTVPALLTPGEFVVNRKAAQNIGYGNLNRMNKVGKYAKGGVVQHFANGTGPTGVQRRAPYQAPNIPSAAPQIQQLSQAAATTAQNVTQLGQSANNASQSNNNARQATNNAGLALSLIPATIQSFLPPIDESSSALAKLTSSALNTVTMLGSVVFALESFGVSLNTSSVLQFLKGGGKGISGTFANKATAFGRSGVSRLGNSIQNISANSTGILQSVGKVVGNGLSNILAPAVGNVAGGFASLLGPLTLAAGAFYAVNTATYALFDAFGDFDNRLKKATSTGNVEEAGKVALQKTEATSLSRIAGGAAAGATAGAFIPIIGPIVGAAIGAGIGLALSDSAEAAVTQARAAAQLTKTQNSLQQASEKTTEAMDDFQRGTITATQALQATAFASQEVVNLRKENEAANTAAEANRDSGFSAGLRNVVTLGGFLGESSGARNARIDKEIEDRNKATKETEKERIKQAQPQLQAVARQVAGRGGAAGDFNAYLQEIKFADPDLYELLIRQGTQQLEKQFNNVSTEVKRAQEAFKAMNLGLQGVAAAANAGVIGLNNYLAAQEFGNNAINQTVATLEAGITSAAQGISDADFGQALSDASESLLELGATPEQVAKVQNNIRAVNTAQKQFPSALESLRKTFEEDVKAGRGVNASPERQKVLIGDILQQQLKDAGISEEARAAFKAQFDNLKLDENAINKLLAGDLSVLEGPLKEIGEAALNQLLPVLKAQAEAQDALNKVLRSKIELENQLVSAQRQRLDIELEAAEIAAKYGGPAVTPEIRRQNVLAQANLQAGGTGAPTLTQGTAAEFNARSAATRNRLNEIANVRLQAAQIGPAGQAAREQIRNESGIQLDAEQRRLQELAKSDFETTKQLIKLKEDELQLIKEKNKLEQDSIQSLISGDIEKFFEQQAAVGATAAIATGNQSLINAFGASALGAAAQDIQRQQQAGQQTLFGQQLGGANGLTERAFGAAIGARGIQDPRLAAIAAGTTAEEVSLQKDIVDLAGTLNNYGDFLIENANNELLAADKQLQAAQQQLDAATQRVQQQQQQAQAAKPLPPEVAAGKRFGGLIYASTGKFIDFKPRGTDIVPAMLTPGEFVVRREAVQRGNNLSILKAMNRGQSAPASDGVASMARGGVVRYRENGSDNPESGGGFGSFIQSISNFGNALTNFNQKFEENINKLNNTTFNIKLDASNINVNLTGTSFIGKLKEDLQADLFAEIGRRLGNYQVSDGGKLMENRGIVPRA